MENRDRTRDQGGEEGKAGQGGDRQQGGREGQGGIERLGQGGGQPGSREGQGERQDLAKSSKFVRNEGLATEGQDVRQEQGGSRDQGEYEYKGGRQGTGGIPNADDQDDNDSAGSFRGTAEQEPVADDEQSVGARQRPNEDLNSQPRNPK